MAILGLLFEPNTMILCSSLEQKKKIRALFQKEIITIPYVIPFLNNIVENLPWEKLGYMVFVSCISIK